MISNLIALTQFHIRMDNTVSGYLAAFANLNVVVNNRIRANLNIISQLRGSGDNSGGMNTCHTRDYFWVDMRAGKILFIQQALQLILLTLINTCKSKRLYCKYTLRSIEDRLDYCLYGLLLLMRFA